jgi:hypothetical protein
MAWLGLILGVFRRMGTIARWWISNSTISSTKRVVFCLSYWDMGMRSVQHQHDSDGISSFR